MISHHEKVDLLVMMEQRGDTFLSDFDIYSNKL